MIEFDVRPMWYGNACVTHCCKLHGCKYRHENCVVETGLVPQAYECEDCSYAGIKMADFPVILMPKSQKIAVLRRAAAELELSDLECAYLEYLIRRKTEKRKRYDDY